MSWGAMKKIINSNFKKPLNEQLRDYSLIPYQVFTTSTLWTPPRNGFYRVICIGAGGNANSYNYTTPQRNNGGGAGGVAVDFLTLSNTLSYNISVSGDASFNNIITGYKGADGGNSINQPGIGGGGIATATGFIYKGNDAAGGKGGSVGIFIDRHSDGGFAKYSYTSGGQMDASIIAGGGGFGGGASAGGFVNSSGDTYISGGTGVFGGNGEINQTTNNISIGAPSGLGGGRSLISNSGGTMTGGGASAAVIVQFIAEI